MRGANASLIERPPPTAPERVVSASAPGRLRHIPALDGVRGVSVLAVLAFHLERLKGGFLGVDAFFVLSGFLITTLLILEVDSTGGIRLRWFWIRRARRLLPALAIVLGAVCIYAAWLADPAELSRLRGDALATLAYVANWHSLVADDGYWRLFTAPSPLEHAWSLAIEEQFYLVWPLVVFLAVRRAKGDATSAARMLFGVSTLAAGLSVMSMAVTRKFAGTEAAYLATHNRAASILVGAVAALGPWAVPRTWEKVSRAAETLMAPAAVVVVAAFFVADGTGTLLYTGGFLVFELAVAVLIVGSLAAEKHPVTRLLSSRFLTWAGVISYALYLWHWVVIAVLTPERLGFSGAARDVLIVALSFQLAVASTYLVERPIRARGLPRTLNPRWFVPTVAIAMVVAVFLSTSGAQEVAGAVSADALAVYDDSAKDPDAVKVMVVGDSVANSLAPGLRAVEDREGLAVANRSVVACTVIGPDPRVTSEPVLRFRGKVVRNPPCQRGWDVALSELDPELVVAMFGGASKKEMEVNGRPVDPCDAEYASVQRDHLSSAMKKLTTTGAKVVLLTSPHFSAPNLPPQGDEWVECINEVSRQVAASSRDVVLVDLDAYVCPGEVCVQYVNDDVPLRPDGVHFSFEGSTWVAEWLAPRLRDVAEQRR